MCGVLSCYFPTTIVMIDDDETFLDVLSNSIETSHVILKKFTNPVEALDYINSVSADNSLSAFDIMFNGEESRADIKSALLNINALHMEVYNIERFSKISTIIVDYSMDNMNGVELCSKITDPNIQKILLTGVGDDSLAIHAFNNGYINKFVKKGFVDFYKSVSANINRAAYQYFQVHTMDVAKHLSVHVSSHLKDPVFANFFSQICASKSYVEYYMLDCFGSYVFVSQSGRLSFLSVCTECEVENLINIAIDSGEASDYTINSLQSREFILAVHSKNGLIPPVKEWEKYLRPAKTLNGYQTYYFCFADDFLLDIDENQIKSFNKLKF